MQSNGVDVDANKNTGNIAKQTLNFAGLTNPLVQTYKYDSLYRLTEARETTGANQTWKETFSYDRYGNRTGHEKYSGTTQLTLNAVSQPSINPLTNRFNTGQFFTYDKNGNIIQDKDDNGAVRTYLFDGNNKQRFVAKSGSNLAEYSYDGEGKRVKKIVYESNGTTVKEETVFVYSAGKLAEEYSTKQPPTNPTTSYTGTDQIGSPRVITDSIGGVVSRRDFMPFGEEIANNIGERDPTNPSLKYNAPDSVRQKFTGYQKDDETELNFAEARMYEERHGRFTAVDPLLASGKSATPQSFNRYTYVMNNPLVLTDPEGLQAGWYTRTNPNNKNPQYRYFEETPTEDNWSAADFGGFTQLYLPVQGAYSTDGNYLGNIYLSRYSNRTLTQEEFDNIGRKPFNPNDLPLNERVKYIEANSSLFRYFIPSWLTANWIAKTGWEKSQATAQGYFGAKDFMETTTLVGVAHTNFNMNQYTGGSTVTNTKSEIDLYYAVKTEADIARSLSERPKAATGVLIGDKIFTGTRFC